MSLTLTQSGGQTFELTRSGWQAVLELARQRGWPQASIIEELSPPYRLNDRDASALGEMVLKAVNSPAGAGPVAREEIINLVFNTRSANHWKRFAGFCRNGGFLVSSEEDE